MVKFNSKKELYKDIMLIFIFLFIIFVLLFVPFFSEIFHSLVTFPLYHGSSYGKGILLVSALLFMSLVIFIRNILVKDKELPLQNIHHLKKKVVTFTVIFFVLVIVIASIGLFLEFKINSTYLNDRSRNDYWSLKEYVPSVRVYNPNNQIFYGTTSTYHSHSLKGMFYMILPDEVQQNLWYR